MDLGLAGLGRMGANMARRWRRNGHTVGEYARTGFGGHVGLTKGKD